MTGNHRFTHVENHSENSCRLLNFHQVVLAESKLVRMMDWAWLWWLDE